jgi:hypothetical protein
VRRAQQSAGTGPLPRLHPKPCASRQIYAANSFLMRNTVPTPVFRSLAIRRTPCFAARALLITVNLAASQCSSRRRPRLIPCSFARASPASTAHESWHVRTRQRLPSSETLPGPMVWRYRGPADEGKDRRLWRVAPAGNPRGPSTTDLDDRPTKPPRRATDFSNASNAGRSLRPLAPETPASSNTCTTDQPWRLALVAAVPDPTKKSA